MRTKVRTAEEYENMNPRMPDPETRDSVYKAYVKRLREAHARMDEAKFKEEERKKREQKIRKSKEDI